MFTYVAVVFQNVTQISERNIGTSDLWRHFRNWPELCVTATAEEVYEQSRVDLGVMHAMQAVVRVVEHQRRRREGRHWLGLVGRGLVKLLAAGLCSTLSLLGCGTEDSLENLRNGETVQIIAFRNQLRTNKVISTSPYMSAVSILNEISN